MHSTRAGTAEIDRWSSKVGKSVLRRIVVRFVWMWLLCSPLWAQGTATDTSHTLTVTTSANGKVHVASSASLTESGALFGNFTASISLQYYARTLTGFQITAQATSDFGACSPGTPSIACNTVHYTCGTASFGNACTTSTTLSTSSATNVLALPSATGCVNGVNPCGPTNPFTVPLTFTLSNDPAYQTGSYSATLQFTLSAT